MARRVCPNYDEEAKEMARFILAGNSQKKQQKNLE